MKSKSKLPSEMTPEERHLEAVSIIASALARYFDGEFSPLILTTKEKSSTGLNGLSEHSLHYKKHHNKHYKTVD